LREAGLSTDEIESASEAVVELTDEAATDLKSFFADRETVYSDMDLAHSSSDVQEHTVDSLDLFTHADDIRGTSGSAPGASPVEGGRVLSEDAVELTLGPTVDARVRFAADREAL